MTMINKQTNNSFSSGWNESMHTGNSLKDLYHSRRVEREFEFAESDFYEDNIYDEPEYRYSDKYIKSGNRL